MSLGKIALALSGGGYRASGFHLGTLECLEKLGLLNDVKVLSTVSGGTFTGAAYALARARGKSFREFCDGFAGSLQNTNVIEIALGQLPETRQTSVNASLICAAARVYDKVLFENAYFDELLTDGTFDEIAFNSTEFVYGLSFRFARSSSGAFIGNKYFSVPVSAAKAIRISDIVAASSCFPGGFEPILFPHQFRFKDGITPAELKAGDFQKPIPLMDGGIYDNQGIGSVLLAHNRKREAFDFLLISDTDQSGGEIYRDPGSTPNGFFKLQYLFVFLAGAFGLSLLSSLSLLASFWTSPRASWYGTILLQVVPLVPLLLATGGIAYGWWSWRSFKKGLDPRLADVVLERLSQLTLPELGVFARNRVASVLAMTLSIFMKRIRDLSRSEAQDLQKENVRSDRDTEANSGDADAEERGNKFVVETRIVKIPGQGKLAAFAPVVAWLTPTADMLAVTDLAKKLGTQLWFNSAGPDSPERVMRALRLSGEITLCASLLQHLVRDRRQPGSTLESPVFAPALDGVYQRARRYWETELAEKARAFNARR